MQKRTDTSTMELKERLVYINRVAKVVKAVSYTHLTLPTT